MCKFFIYLFFMATFFGCKTIEDEYWTSKDISLRLFRAKVVDRKCSFEPCQRVSALDQHQNSFSGYRLKNRLILNNIEIDEGGMPREIQQLVLNYSGDSKILTGTMIFKEVGNLRILKKIELMRQ